MTMVTVGVSVDTEVDVDSADVLPEVPVEDLRKELQGRGVVDDDDPLVRIWRSVTYQGIALEDVVEDLMRERGYRWPPAHCKGAETA